MKRAAASLLCFGLQRSARSIFTKNASIFSSIHIPSVHSMMRSFPSSSSRLFSSESEEKSEHVRQLELVEVFHETDEAVTSGDITSIQTALSKGMPKLEASNATLAMDIPLLTRTIDALAEKASGTSHIITLFKYARRHSLATREIFVTTIRACLKNSDIENAKKILDAADADDVVVPAEVRLETIINVISHETLMACDEDTRKDLIVIRGLSTSNDKPDMDSAEAERLGRVYLEKVRPKAQELAVKYINLEGQRCAEIDVLKDTHLDVEKAFDAINSINVYNQLYLLMGGAVPPEIEEGRKRRAERQAALQQTVKEEYEAARKVVSGQEPTELDRMSFLMQTAQKMQQHVNDMVSLRFEEYYEGIVPEFEVERMKKIFYDLKNEGRLPINNGKEQPSPPGFSEAIFRELKGQPPILVAVMIDIQFANRSLGRDLLSNPGLGGMAF